MILERAGISLYGEKLHDETNGNTEEIKRREDLISGFVSAIYNLLGELGYTIGSNKLKSKLDDSEDSIIFDEIGCGDKKYILATVVEDYIEEKEMIKKMRYVFENNFAEIIARGAEGKPVNSIIKGEKKSEILEKARGTEEIKKIMAAKKASEEEMNLEKIVLGTEEDMINAQITKKELEKDEVLEKLYKNNKEGKEDVLNLEGEREKIWKEIDELTKKRDLIIAKYENILGKQGYEKYKEMVEEFSQEWGSKYQMEKEWLKNETEKLLNNGFIKEVIDYNKEKIKASLKTLKNATLGEKGPRIFSDEAIFSLLTKDGDILYTDGEESQVKELLKLGDLECEVYQKKIDEDSKERIIRCNAKQNMKTIHWIQSDFEKELYLTIFTNENAMRGDIIQTLDWHVKNALSEIKVNLSPPKKKTVFYGY